MTPTPLGAPPHLVEALARIAKKNRVARKLVVSPNIAAGRELLRRLSLTYGGWIGFEVTTPRPMALRLARAAMERAGLSTLDAVRRAVDARPRARFGVGLGGWRPRRALGGCGIPGQGPRSDSSASTRGGPLPSSSTRLVWRTGESGFSCCGSSNDTSVFSPSVGVPTRLRCFGSVSAALEDAGGQLPASLDADLVLLLPGLGTRGLTGELIAALGARGARVLETDPVLGLDVPEAVLWNRQADPAPGSALNAPGERYLYDRTARYRLLPSRLDQRRATRGTPAGRTARPALGPGRDRHTGSRGLWIGAARVVHAYGRSRDLCRRPPDRADQNRSRRACVSRLDRRRVPGRPGPPTVGGR